MFDIFQKRWRDGGLTFSQLTVLYDHLQKQRTEEFKIQAKLHGVQIKGEEESKFTTKDGKEVPLTLFKDQSEYADMTEEEKQRETERMMKSHKIFAKNF